MVHAWVTARVNRAFCSTWLLKAWEGQVSSPTEPPPLPLHAGRRLDGARLGDGPSESGLLLHLAPKYAGGLYSGQSSLSPSTTSH